MKTFYRQRLPHWQPVGGCFFVTFRLYNSIPKVCALRLKKDFEAARLQLKKGSSSENRMKDRRLLLRYFLNFEHKLEKETTGPLYLGQPQIAKVIQESLHLFDEQWYELLAYCIMPNHVHLVIDTAWQIRAFTSPREVEEKYVPLDRIMKRIKGRTAYQANKLLRRKGPFWQAESYDHCIRNGKALQNIIRYVARNPQKAGLIEDWRQWEYTYLAVPL